MGRRFEVRPWTAHYGLLSLPSEIKIGDGHDEFGFSVYPFANLFPLIEGADFTRLVTDIKENSLREPIMTTCDGRIIDGRDRYRAYVAASIAPRTGILDIDDAGLLSWILRDTTLPGWSPTSSNTACGSRSQPLAMAALLMVAIAFLRVSLRPSHPEPKSSSLTTPGSCRGFSTATCIADTSRPHSALQSPQTWPV